MNDSLSGSLVVASPSMNDPQFEHAVLLMVEHSDDGAMGLILNQPTTTKVDAVWDQLSVLPCPVDQTLMRGGPCEGPLMLLHDQPRQSQVDVCKGVCFTADETIVRELLSGETNAIRFFVGYAGWGPGQLEHELNHGGWLVTPASAQVVFDPDADDGLWMRVITGIDRSLAMLAMNPKLMPRDPSMN
ncbi:MAG: YqgE/AlgH family protein [Phycisphaeraceae bacterium]